MSLTIFLFMILNALNQFTELKTANFISVTCFQALHLMDVFAVFVVEHFITVLTHFQYSNN
jgi:hypothetical protein